MLSDQALTRALERVGLQAPVRFEEVTRSTQATALLMASEGAPEWTLVAAGHQTEGRGRMGRTWEDEPGRALLFSFVLRPELDPADAGLLSLLAGIAMAEASDDAAEGPATCKWPNDLLIDGRKAGGTLAESRLAGDRIEHIALGVGINLGSAPARLAEAAAVEAGAEDLLVGFLGAFARRYRLGAAVLSEAVLPAYRERCSTLGRRVRARTTGGALVDGEAVDVDEAGGLVIRTPDGLEVVRFGEAEHLE